MPLKMLKLTLQFLLDQEERPQESMIKNCTKNEIFEHMFNKLNDFRHVATRYDKPDIA